MRLYILFSLRISLIRVLCACVVKIWVRKNVCRWRWAANYYKRRIRRAPVSWAALGQAIRFTADAILHCFRSNAQCLRWVISGHRDLAAGCPLCLQEPTQAATSACPLGAINGSHLVYSITSSARPSNEGGTVSPMALAVLRLMTSSNLIGCSIGKSAGFSPFKTFCT
jgi:hypothetical protein